MWIQETNLGEETFFSFSQMSDTVPSSKITYNIQSTIAIPLSIVKSVEHGCFWTFMDDLDLTGNIYIVSTDCNDSWVVM